MVQQKQIRLGTMRLQVQSLALLSGLRIRCCHKLWCRSQTWLGSRIAVLWPRPKATAPIRPLAWEPPYAAGAAQEMAKRQKQKTKNKTPASSWILVGFVTTELQQNSLNTLEGFLLLLLLLLLFLGPLPRHMEVPRPGVESEL